MDPILFPIAVAVTNGIVAIINKIAPGLRNLAPVWALQVGMLSYSLLAGFTLPNVAYGLVVGLTAVGMFSSVKNVRKGI